MMPDVLPEMHDGFYDSPTQRDTKTPYQELKDIISGYPGGPDFSETYSYYRDKIAPALKRVDAADLSQNGGELLTLAVKHNASYCVEELISRTTDWSENVVCDAIYDAANNQGHSSISHLLRLDFPRKKEILSELNSRKSTYSPQVQSAIETGKANFIGSQWKKISEHEISHTVSSNIATIERVFNFNAMSIITLAKREDNITMTERNFSDVQDDTDIVRAHETLSIFEQPPVYRGKNHNPRRSVNKRNSGKL